MRRWFKVFTAAAVVFAVSLYAFNLADRIGRTMYLIFAVTAGVVIAAVLATLDAIDNATSSKWSRLRGPARRIVDEDDDDE